MASLLLSALEWQWKAGLFRPSPAYEETLAPGNWNLSLTRKSTTGELFSPWLNDNCSTLTTTYYQAILQAYYVGAHYGNWCFQRVGLVFNFLVFIYSPLFSQGVCVIYSMHIYNLCHTSWLTTEGLFGKAAPCWINKTSVLVLPWWAVKQG